MKYRACNIVFAVKTHTRLERCWDQFNLQNCLDNPEMYIDIKKGIYVGYGIELLQTGADNLLFWDHTTLMCTTPTWDRISIFITDYLPNHTGFLLQAFHTHAVRRQMVQLHCATIDDQGRGVLFLGPSGIGKTTQAERWAEFRGSSIINGDVGFVQRTEREYIAWGTPWHGSSPYCLNASVPVKALVVLKQAPENRLRELTGFEKVSEIAGSVFYPTWLEDGMELCTDTLNHLLTDLPVYRLDNRADRESVEILAKELDRIT